MGSSPIPTDICLVLGLDNISVDKFVTPEQSLVYNIDDPLEELDYKASPSPIADSYDWANDDIDNACALIDTGAMVTCTGTKYIIHNYRLYTKLKRCLIWLKAALTSSNNSVIPKGYGFLHVRSAGDGYHKILVYYHPSIIGTLLSLTSIITSAHDLNTNFTGQSIHRWFDNDTMLTGNIMLVSHH